LKAVNRGTGNTVAKGKRRKKEKQTTIYKTLNMNATKNDVCTQVLRINKSGSTCGIRRVAPVTNR
jgi:hypothetical protein